MTTIQSRTPTPPLPNVSLSNEEVLLILSLLHCSSLRTFGTGYPHHAYLLAEKLTSEYGIQTSEAARIVDPNFNLYDDQGNYVCSYPASDITIVYK
jgi:hypothetical protein